MSCVFVLLTFGTIHFAVQAAYDPQAEPPATDRLADAKAVMAQEQWKPAANAFLRFLRKQPNAPEAFEATFWAGYCMVKEGDFEHAIQVLAPFAELESQSNSKWADDALLQLGYAYQGADDWEEALACWRRLLERYQSSVWRAEALQNCVSLLYSRQDFAACFPLCEQVMTESNDPNATWETRYVGAYCLNALGRFDEAEAWTAKWFEPASPLHEAWRTVLTAQRELLENRSDAALEAVASLQHDFADLETGEWLDALMRTSYMLRQNGQPAHARPLLIGAIARLGGQSQDQIGWVIDELGTVIGSDRPQEFLDELTRLSESESTPISVRVTIRDRHVADLRANQQGAEAAELLRRALEKEPVEFARVRAATVLAEVLANDLQDPDRAITLLDEVLPNLKRRDFKFKVRQQLEDCRRAAAAK